MQSIPRNRSIIRDFPGEINGQDPLDMPHGAGQLQFNLASQTAGLLESRNGFRFVSFGDTTIISTLTAD